jgi:hypothetical protein
MSDSSTSLPCEKKMTPNKTGINSAGLLFGTSSRESSPDENRATIYHTWVEDTNNYTIIAVV